MWKYKFIFNSQIDNLMQEANELGKQGWELVSATTVGINSNYYTLFFKKHV